MTLRACIILLVVVVLNNTARSQTTWQKTYGAFGIDEGHGIRETSDHGFIVVGSTGSFGAGSSDVYVLKLDSAGSRTWSVAIGGPSVDQGWSIRQLGDGGFIVAGFTQGDPGNGYDGLLIRLDGSGGVLWQKSIGGPGWNFFYDVEDLNDGFALAGTTQVDGNAQGWLVRTDLSGNVLWEHDFGGDGDDEARSVRLTTDGGFVVAGTWALPDSTSDALIIKFDAAGVEEWSSTLGGEGVEVGYSIVETSDGGYVVGGSTTSFSPTRGMLLGKVDASGNFLWTNQVSGGTGDWDGRSVRENYDGGLVLAGITSSFGAGGYDYYMAQTDPDGYWISGPNFGTAGDEQCWGMDLVSDGGYILVGTTDGIGPGSSAVYVVKNAGDVITDPLVTDFDPLVVGDEVSDDRIIIFPNPVISGGTMNLAPAKILNNGWEVEILDLKGSLVGNAKGRPGDRLMSVPTLPSGTYVLRFSTPSIRILSSPIIVQAE